MTKRLSLLLLVFLSACSSIPSSNNWSRYTFDLSGHTFSVSSPRGHFRDEYLPQVDLAANEKSYVTLLSKSWVFSGLLSDQGGMDFIIGLNRSELGATDADLIRGINRHLSDAYRKLRPEGVQVTNVTKRQLGGRNWLCYSVSDISAQCALKVDSNYYISWRLLDINNASSQIEARDNLRMAIEDSLQIAF